MTSREINVPIELCLYALRTSSYRALRFVIIHKLVCDGTIHINDSRIDAIKETFYGSEKTYKRHLKRAIEERWIWINRRKGILHLNSFDSITRHLGKSSKRVRVSRDEMLNEKYTAAFFMSAVIGNKIKNNRKSLGKKAESLSGDSIIPFDLGFNPTKSKPYFGYSVSGIAKMVGISVGNAQRLKNIAAQNGWIEVKSVRRPLLVPAKNTDSTGNQKYHYVHKRELGHMKATFPAQAHKLWPHRGYIYIWENDEIIPRLHIISRKVNKKRLRLQLLHKIQVA